MGDGLTVREVTPDSCGVIFVNYHSDELIRTRARRFVDAGFHVVVVDNSATYGASGGGEQVIDPGANVGFGAACNLGVAALPDDVATLVFHNPDVDISVADVGTLSRELAAQARPGLIGPAELQGALLRPMGYHYPSFVREAALVVRTMVRGSSSDAPAASARRRAATSGRRFGSGALLVAARPTFTTIGGFDERYFLYNEDLDLWHRTAAVADVDFSATVTARHASGRGSAGGSPARELLRFMGLELFEQVHGRPSAWRGYRAIHRVAVRRLTADAPSWAQDLRRAWREGADPAAVQARLRPALTQRDAA